MLAPVGDRSFLEIQLERWQAQGFGSFVLSLATWRRGVDGAGAASSSMCRSIA